MAVLRSAKYPSAWTIGVCSVGRPCSESSRTGWYCRLNREEDKHYLWNAYTGSRHSEAYGTLNVVFPVPKNSPLCKTKQNKKPKPNSIFRMTKRLPDR